MYLFSFQFSLCNLVLPTFVTHVSVFLLYFVLTFSNRIFMIIFSSILTGIIPKLYYNASFLGFYLFPLLISSFILGLFSWFPLGFFSFVI